MVVKNDDPKMMIKKFQDLKTRQSKTAQLERTPGWKAGNLMQ